MKNQNSKLRDISEDDILQMIKDTSQLIGKYDINQLENAVIAAQSSNALTNNVEFWKWMGRNYNSSRIFDSSYAMQQYINKNLNNEQWLIKQLQGKGYEWDWMVNERTNLKNVLNTYDAGDIANRAASDVTQKNIINGKTKEYQMKAYTSKANPHLKNTPKDMTVVTNTEKVNSVKGNGYGSVEEFQDSQIISNSTNKRLEQVKDGKAYTSYNLRNVAGTMAKAGVIGCAIGIGTEAILSYKSWKSGELSDQEYFKEIIKAGGDAGITAGATEGIMIPISATITAAGASTLLTIPIAFIVGGAINKIVAPCFGRGKYKEILLNAKYYQSLEEIYNDMINSMYNASEQYYQFVNGIQIQQNTHKVLKQKSIEINNDLKDLYNSI